MGLGVELSVNGAAAHTVRISILVHPRHGTSSYYCSVTHGVLLHVQTSVTLDRDIYMNLMAREFCT
jgi:hypothetical protein